MSQRYFVRTAAFILLAIVAFSFGLTPSAKAWLNCTEECGAELRSDLAACATYTSDWEKYMCNCGAYMAYGGCQLVCNTLGQITNLLGIYPPSIVWYNPGGDDLLGFRRYDSLGFLEGQGSITNVGIFIIANDDIDTTVELKSMAWQFLGNAVFNSETSCWEIGWNTTAYDSPNGYLIMADYLDPTLEGGEGFGMALAMMPVQRPVPALTKWGLSALIALIILSAVIIIYIPFKN